MAFWVFEPQSDEKSTLSPYHIGVCLDMGENSTILKRNCNDGISTTQAKADFRTLSQSAYLTISCSGPQ
jgi:hypothetical protein